jgi:hypothetical protein
VTNIPSTPEEETDYFNSLTESEKKHYCIGFMRGMEFSENLRNATPEQILAWYISLRDSGLDVGSIVTQDKIDRLQAYVDSKKKVTKRGWFSVFLDRIL